MQAIARGDANATMWSNGVCSATRQSSVPETKKVAELLREMGRRSSISAW